MWRDEYEIMRAARKRAARGEIADAVFLGLTEEDARMIWRLSVKYHDANIGKLKDLKELIELAKRTGISPHELRLMGINPDPGD